MAAQNFQVVLLDIEGTVCPISFVKDILYPYSIAALPKTLAEKWDDPAFAPYIEAFPAEYRTPAALSAHFEDLVSKDIKASYLKGLQGLLWKDGYRSGEITAPLFADVVPALQQWKAAGTTLMIYSSGSVAAQKLLFEYTGVVDQKSEAVDINPLLSDYFDTINAGPKTARASYEKIVAAHPEFPDAARWLFLSDNVLEVEAAQAAGLTSYVVSRPGNAVTGKEDAHRVVTTFENLL